MVNKIKRVNKMIDYNYQLQSYYKKVKCGKI